ncbi:MAG: methyltransferase domain-containing protein [archaeon]
MSNQEKDTKLSEIRKLQYKMINSFNQVPKEGKEVEWFGKKFLVHKEVFWPSNDSLTMVEKFKIKKGETVLDVCTGSGNIAIISAYLGAKKVIGVDISPNAIKCAIENAKNHGFSKIIEFRLGNALEPLKPDEKFDVITINPPFTNVCVESFAEKTIFNGDLKLYQDFFSKVNDYLNPSGRIYITQASFGAFKEMKHLAKKSGFSVKKINEKVMTDIPRAYYAFELHRKLSK